MKILVANRGEIACRILRTLRTLQIPSVAMCTEVDRHAAHVWLADEVHMLDSRWGARGYLDEQAIVTVACASGATAIHPGYGFVSQSPSFARLVQANNLILIGPDPESMALLGDKRGARQLAQSADVPVLPGAEACDTLVQAQQAAAKVGYPLLLKAAAGGGGKGMRLVEQDAQLAQAFVQASREAQQAFADGRLLLERYLFPARHIEIQVLADGQEAIAFAERECSLQRRYQKLIEESPSARISPSLRDKLQQAAIRLMRKAKYKNAATVEFLVDTEENFYFLEVNTRLQVEHPVTEWCHQIDLVAEQIELAHGKKVADVVLQPSFGHAIEVRLNAENPAQQFLPTTGTIHQLVWPQGPGIRVDAGIEIGSSIGVDYDPLLAKLIAWAPTRTQAIARLAQALRETVILGIECNQAFLLELLQSAAFLDAETYTHTVEASTWPKLAIPEIFATFAESQCQRQPTAMGTQPSDLHSPWQTLRDFRMQ